MFVRGSLNKTNIDVCAKRAFFSFRKLSFYTYVSTHRVQVRFVLGFVCRTVNTRRLNPMVISNRITKFNFDIMRTWNRRTLIRSKSFQHPPLFNVTLLYNKTVVYDFRHLSYVQCMCFGIRLFVRL